MKICSKCKINKNTDEYYTHNKYGYRSECKKCTKKNSAKVWKRDKKKLTKKNREWLAANKDKRSRYTKVQSLRRKYNITLAEYEKMIETQQGKCKICEVNLNEVRQFDVDHCHKTGKVRGLLCTSCNSGIGFLRDSPEILKKALNYIETQGE